MRLKATKYLMLAKAITAKTLNKEQQTKLKKRLLN